MRRFRHLTQPGDIGLAAYDVDMWGYPRPIEEIELTESGWWRYGHDCILWIQAVKEERMTGILHLCVAPSSRVVHKMGARRLFQGVDILADLYCLELLIATDCEEGGPVADYLRRLGWEKMTLDGIEGEWFGKRFPSFGAAA